MPGYVHVFAVYELGYTGKAQNSIKGFMRKMYVI